MKKILFLLFIIIKVSINAQSVDFNTEKGFIAEGYDVVSYFSNIAKEGNKKYVATYDGVKFKFSSKKNLNTFNSNPKKYIPQYGGYCAYALAVKAKKISINPETFEIRNNKLYLFYNSWGNNTLESWKNESPDDLKKRADQNWEKIKYN